MATSSIKYLKRTDELSIDSQNKLGLDGVQDGFYGPLEWLGNVSLSQLVRAARVRINTLGKGLGLYVCKAPAGQFLQSRPAPELIHLRSDGERIFVHVVDIKRDPPTLDVLDDLLPQVLTPIFDRHGGHLETLAIDRAPPTQMTRVHLSFSYAHRARTVGDAILAGRDAFEAVGAALRGVDAPDDAFAAVRRGHVGALVGQPESAWLEAKRSPYRLQTLEEKFELAKDVAALANTSKGGLIVLGLATGKRDGRDVVNRITPFDLDKADPKQMRQILRSKIYPPVERIEIDRVAIHGTRGIAYIRVPRQDPVLKPFVLAGALSDGRVKSQYLTIPTRVEDEVEYSSPAAIHSLILAGRVALKR